MKIATFNANSIRVRLDIILDWMAEHEPDVLAIQETKCEDAKFPLAEFEEAGYQVAFHGQKSYNGVAMISRQPMQDIRMGMGDPAFPEDCRILRAGVDGITIVNTYVPNGTKVGSEKWDYKLRWFDRFYEYLATEIKQNPRTVWLGDINVAPTPDDVFDSPKMLGGVCHHPDEFSRLERLKSLGLVDLFRKFTDGPGNFSYWEFVIPRAVERNLGWRIDHIYTPTELAERCTSCIIDKAPRMLERPSDHTFVMAEFSD